MEFDPNKLWALLPFVMTLLVIKPLARFAKLIVAALLLGLLAGCGTVQSNKFDKSPCACQFQPFEAVDETEVQRG